MNANNNLFVSILSTNATAEAAKQALREAIFWQIVNTSAMNSRVDENLFDVIKKEAENAAQSDSAEFYCDNKTVDKFSFVEGDTQRQLRTLQRLYNTVTQYQAWYNDADGNGDNSYGFCWQYNNHSYRLIFK